MKVAYVGPCCVGVDNNNPMSEGGDYEWTHLYMEHLLTNGVNPTTVSKNPFGGQYGDIVPELADSWEVSSDQLTWTFHLHPGIKWDDGTAFTADDVKFSAELCLNPKIGVPCYPGSGFSNVVGAADVIAGKATEMSGIKVVDPNTVSMTTATPSALLPYLVQDLFIVQKASVGAIPVDQVGKSQYWNTPNDASGKGGVQGTGPFIVSAYSAGQSMEVRRNDNYWRSKPFLDNIIRQEFKDTATALLAFDAGQVDVTYVQPGEDAKREATSTVGTLLPGPSGVDLNLVCNPNKIPDCSKKEVRQALLFAIDRKSILENVYGIQNPTLLSCEYIDPALIPSDVMTYDYNVDKAKSLLQSVNVDPTKWGEVVFDTYYQDAVSLAAMTAIQANLADIGVTVKIQQMDSASWSDRYYGKGSAPSESQMSMIGGGQGIPSTGYGNDHLNSVNAYPKGGNGWNGFHWTIPDLDTALNAVQTDFDHAKLVTDAQQACRVEAENQPYINLWATTRYWLVNNRIGNFVNTPGPGMGNYYKAAEMWYIRS
jgi:peptide/nickel transport system substrate-binding protein